MTSYGPVQWSKTAGLNSTADVNVYVKEGMAPSATNDQFRSIMQSFAKYRDDNNGTLVSGGSTTAATLATNQVFTALATGLTVSFGVAGTLSSGATLAVDGLAAAPLQLVLGTTMVSSQIQGGTIVAATYLGTPISTGVWLVNTSINGGIGNLMTLTGTEQLVSGGAEPNTVFWGTSTTSSTANVQIDYGKGPMQKLTNNSVFVLKAPANDGFCSLLVSNTTGAGTITTSGFKVSSFTGDAVTTTTGNNYVWNLMTINGTSTYMIKALQ